MNKFYTKHRNVPNNARISSEFTSAGGQLGTDSGIGLTLIGPGISTMECDAVTLVSHGGACYTLLTFNVNSATLSPVHQATFDVYVT